MMQFLKKIIMNNRYIVLEWPYGINTILNHNTFTVNDISEFMNDEIGIGQFRGEIIIIDTIENKIIDNKSCQWTNLENF